MRATVALSPLLLPVTSILLAACVSVSVHTTGAASTADLRAEDAYIAAYMQGMTALQVDFRAFAPSGANPGVCNKGGTKQGCFAADAAALVDLRAMSEALRATTVPPRFVEADRLLRDAVEQNIQALELRNQALSTGDESAWDRHGPLLETAQRSWTAGYAAFPADHRPALAP